MGKTITDNEYASILLGSLPESYTAMLGSIAAATELSRRAVSSAIVVKIATDEYDHRTLQNGKTKDEAFTTSPQKKGKKRDIECENCHKKGHTSAKCWAKGGGDEEGGPKHRKPKDDDKSNVATSSKKMPDIEAWPVIEEMEIDGVVPSVPNVAAQGSADMQSELFDLGASRHMSPFHKSFVTFQSIEARPITAANNKVFHAIGMGDLQIHMPNSTTSSRILLKDTLYAPNLCLIVVSIGHIVKAGYTVQFARSSCDIKRGENGPIIGRIPASMNGLFKVDHMFTATNESALAEPIDILTLHCRLKHISVNAIHTLICAGSITGIQLIENFPPFICNSCEYAKTTQKAICKECEAPQAQAFGNEVHTDVWGPSPNLSLGGRKYYVTFTDDHTRFTELNILRKKDQTFEAYKSFTSWARTQHYACVKQLCSDCGSEFMSNEFNAFLHEQGTEHCLTTANTPQHNGVAESLN